MKQWKISNKHNTLLHSSTCFPLKVQTAFNFSNRRIAVALLDVGDTVLLGSYLHLILKQPVVFFTYETRLLLIYFPLFFSPENISECTKKKKKRQIFYHPFILLHFNMCLANACAVVYQGYSLPAAGVGAKLICQAYCCRYSYVIFWILFTETLSHSRDVRLEPDVHWGWLDGARS